MRRHLGALVLVALAGSGCHRAEQAPAKQYSLEGQVLAVAPEQGQITIKHGDIPGFMPAMTMTYPVASARLLEGRTPGELVAATLEVSDASGRLTAITHKGEAPLPTNTNEAGLVSGLLQAGDEVPDAAFVDQDDRRRSFSEWKGQLTLVTFIYTSCPLPTFCPLMEQNLSTIQHAVAEDPQLAGHVKLISISFDPARDTPAVLAAEAKKHKADPAVWTFLTGDRITLDRFAAKFGVSLVREDGTTDIAHTLRTALVDPQGHIVKFYSGSDWTPGAVLADMRTAVAAAR